MGRNRGPSPSVGEAIGQALVEHIAGSSPDIAWVLRAGRPGAAKFFAKLGFRASHVAMERPRSQSSAD